METKRENIAAENVTFRNVAASDRRDAIKSRFSAELDYLASMLIFGLMLRPGLISGDELAAIDTRMREKYKPILGSL